MSVKDENINFKKRLVSLLITQRERFLTGGGTLDKKVEFKPIGEILRSKEYINYTKNKWKL